MTSDDGTSGVVCGGVRGAVVRKEEVLGMGKLEAANQSTFTQGRTGDLVLTIHESVGGIVLLLRG